MSVITLSDAKLPIDKDEGSLVKLAEKKLGGKVGYFAVKKKSLDARDKGNLRYVYTIEFSKNPPEERRGIWNVYRKENSLKNPFWWWEADLQGCFAPFGYWREVFARLSWNGVGTWKTVKNAFPVLQKKNCWIPIAISNSVKVAQVRFRMGN